jgi:uncharacterized membrane protein
MGKGRLEAFSDGVMAVIITIMVLEIKVPRGSDLGALEPVFPFFLAYALSFVFVGIYWNNHHHLLRAATHIDAKVMWANLHLLFWLSLIPVATGWVGQNPEASTPTALYGAVFLMAGFAYRLLVVAMVAYNGRESALGTAVGSDVKGLASLGVYIAGIGFAFVRPWISDALYVLVALIWLVPDRRLEKAIVQKPG